MRHQFPRAASALLTIALVCALPLRTLAAAPTAASFSTSVPANRQSVIQLQGADADGTALTFATLSAPSHGALSNLNASTGSVIYTPTAAYTGADSFTYKVTSGGQDSSTATVTIAVSNAKTTVADTVTDASGNPRQGKITFILTQQVTTPSGLVPVGTSVSASLSSSGAFSVQLYPSRGMNPTAYYQVWFKDAATQNSETFGVYEIPPSATPVSLSANKLTNTNLAVQYLFVSVAGLEAHTNAVANATIAQLVAQSRTTGKLQKWDGANLSDSIISESGAAATVAGSLTATGGLTAGGTVTATGAMTAAGFNGITPANIPSAVDAAKIGNGSVSSSEFQRLDGVTSSIQTQLDAKAAAAHAHSGADITSGTLPDGRLPSTMAGKTLTGATLTSPTLNTPILNSPTLNNATLPGTTSVTNLNASGTVTATALVGDGSGITNVGVGTSTGHSAPGSVTVMGDDDANGSGVVAIGTGNHTSIQVEADHSITFNGALNGTNLCAVAAAAVGPGNTTIPVMTPQTVASSCTIPSHVTLEFAGRGLVTVADTQTLTLQGLFTGPARQLFSGSISLVGNKSVGELRAVWIGAKGDGATDNAAKLQQAMDILAAADISGTILLDPGVYDVAGPCLDPAGSNAQLLLPLRAGGIGGAQLGLRFEGVAAGTNMGTNVSDSGVVIRSTLSGGDCYLLGRKGTGPLSLNPLTLYFEDVNFRLSDPEMGALDLYYTQQVYFNNVKVDTGQAYGDVDEPAATDRYGVRMPGNNVVGQAGAHNLAVAGFYNCVQWNELSNFNNLTLVNCWTAAKVFPAHHPSNGGRVSLIHNRNGFEFLEGAHAINIAQLNIEHVEDTSKWYYTRFDFKDPNGYGRGRIVWSLSAQNEAGTGNVYPTTSAGSVQAALNVDGAGGLRLEQLSAPKGVMRELNLQNQTASIGSTALYTVPVTGNYRVTYYFVTSVAGSGGTAELQFGWNDGIGAKQLPAPVSIDLTSTATAGLAQGEVRVRMPAGQAINYTTTVTGAAGSPQYAVILTVEAVN